MPDNQTAQQQQTPLQQPGAAVPSVQPTTDSTPPSSPPTSLTDTSSQDFTYPEKSTKPMSGVTSPAVLGTNGAPPAPDSKDVKEPAAKSESKGSDLVGLAKRLSSWKGNTSKEAKPEKRKEAPAETVVRGASDVPPLNVPPVKPESEADPVTVDLSDPITVDPITDSEGVNVVSLDDNAEAVQSVVPSVVPEAVVPDAPIPPVSLPAEQASAPPASPSDVAPVAKDVPLEIPSAAGPGTIPVAGTPTAGSYPYTIDQLLQLVVDKDASDLHVTVGYPSMVRIDGDLMPVGQEVVTEEDVNGLILPVLPENKRELLEVNREVDLAYTHRDQARFRINAFYTKGNISAAFRLIPNRIRSIEELKLPGVFHQLAELPQGLVLITGPTGHGKSTTLASILQEINQTYPKHIITIEDPIEYMYPRGRALVDQREMHEDTHSWEIALRSAMREDPDVVLVGEMRDFETIAAAITLAETGHLVFATLHTNSASQTIDRVIDVFPEHQQAQVRTQLSVILEAVVSQRLIPIKEGGRRAASEVLLATAAVRNLIREGKTHQIDNVLRTSMDVGMKTLEHSLVDLVREGVISVDDAEGAALHPEEVVRLLKV